MKIFISWSGERSRIIAEGLNSWLPKVIEAVKPFYSPEIEKGTKGIEEVNKTLESTSFGIICLTPENLETTWIHYEAGALSKIEGARIWTLLFNLKYSDVIQPLAQFQHTLAQKTDIYKLLLSINAKLPEPLEIRVLNDSFERCWSDLEETLNRADKVTEKEDKKDGKDYQISSLGQFQPEHFPWTYLLKRAMPALFAVKKEIQKANVYQNREEVIKVVDAMVRQLGMRQIEDFQVSVIDDKRILVYHDWTEYIGDLATHMAVDNFDFYDVIFEYEHGAVAWIDKVSNVRPNPRNFRSNIALFTTIDEVKWKVLVEIHQEIRIDKKF